MNPVLEVKNLTKCFGAFPAVERISFSVLPKRIIGFLGPNGAGKTTTLRMIAGLSNPTSGQIFINGIEMKFGDPERARYIGYLPEQPSFYSWMSGREVLVTYGKLSGMTEEHARHRAEELLSVVGLDSAKKRRAGGYSNGMKQRLGIAQALIHDPDLIILDEPVSALDPIGRREVFDLLGRIKKNRTILLSTHVLSDIDKIGDDVIIIRQGHILKSSSIEEIKKGAVASSAIIVFAEPPSEAFIKKLKSAKQITQCIVTGAQLIVTFSLKTGNEINELLSTIALSETPITNISVQEPSLEDVFMNLIAEKK